MGKKKANSETKAQNKQPVIPIWSRRIRPDEKKEFEKLQRSYECLYDTIESSIPVDQLEADEIRQQLAYQCKNIEQQFVELRNIVCMNQSHMDQRRFVTQQILNCLYRHHGIIYQGVIFGSSINGLGFKDSDIDLRLRPLRETKKGYLEPIDCDRTFVDNSLRNIAYQTTRCSPASGCFAPSARCPVAKLQLVTGNPKENSSLKVGLNFDISMLSTNSLGSFNSKYTRFLCHLEPKFHLLAISLRYWSKTQDLIQPGLLSSYALITMLIFFCQNTSPPLLPTVNQMSEAYFQDDSTEKRGNFQSRALVKSEFNCLINLKKESYQKSSNDEPLSLLLLKFFEFFLNFPYTPTTIISTRLGKHIDYEAFKESPIYDESFPMKSILNIQDPFDLKHNVTSGMTPEFFIRFMTVIRLSYERLFTEMNKFERPSELERPENGNSESNSNSEANPKKSDRSLEEWGLSAMFVKVPKKAT